MASISTLNKLETTLNVNTSPNVPALDISLTYSFHGLPIYNSKGYSSSSLGFSFK